MKLWDCSLHTLKNTEIKARTNCVKPQMKKFEFVFLLFV